MDSAELDHSRPRAQQPLKNNENIVKRKTKSKKEKVLNESRNLGLLVFTWWTDIIIEAQQPLNKYEKIAKKKETN